MTDRDRLQNLFDGFAEAALEDTEMARQILADAGYDPDQVATEGASYARELYGTARLRRAAEGRATTGERIAELRAWLIARAREAGGDFKTELARLLSGGDAMQLQAHFRKIDELGEEDALDMLTDAEILRLLGEDEADGSGNPEGDA